MQSRYSKSAKVDDDDGHYIVVPDAELTDKCESDHPFGQIVRANMPRSNNATSRTRDLRQGGAGP